MTSSIDPVPFNTVTNNQTEDIILSGSSFIINAPGNYLVNWQLPVTDAGASSRIIFVILLDAIALPPAFSSPNVAGQMSGTTLLTVTDVPAAMTLVNASEEAVVLSYGEMMTSIVITALSN